MSRIAIAFNDLNLNIIPFWNNGLLLTAGTNAPGKFNPMTIGMGTIGSIWKKPGIMVAVRSTRYTYELIESCESFTVCAFPGQYQKTLGLLGSKSGRDIDKIAKSALTPIPSTKIACPGFDEAELILECQKIYYDDTHSTNANEVVHAFYHGSEYHRLYFGEILAIYGEPHYQKRTDS